MDARRETVAWQVSIGGPGGLTETLGMGATYGDGDGESCAWLAGKVEQGYEVAGSTWLTGSLQPGMLWAASIAYLILAWSDAVV